MLTELGGFRVVITKKNQKWAEWTTRRSRRRREAEARGAAGCFGWIYLPAGSCRRSMEVWACNELVNLAAGFGMCFILGAASVAAFLRGGIRWEAKPGVKSQRER